MMIKLVAASAALLTFTAIGSQDARAWCDEDCVYEAHEATYERAESHEYAREEAEEEGYAERGQRSEQDFSREQRQGRRSAKVDRQDAKRADAKRLAQPQSEAPAPSQPTQTVQPRSKVATENSSITSGSTQIAEDSNFDRPQRQRDVGCKTFFAASGVTLTVPCD